MMEKINLENYEAYFLDFVEGNLTPIQVEELNQFLFEYPELKQELESFDAVSLGEENVSEIPFKGDLLREEETGLRLSDYLMISEIEGTISTKEKEELSGLVKKDASLMDELAIYHKTKLPVESTVVFEAKKALLQKERKPIWWSYASAAAAAILVFVFWNSGTEKLYSPRQVAFAEVKNEQSSSKKLLPLIVEREDGVEKQQKSKLLKKQDFSEVAQVREASPKENIPEEIEVEQSEKQLEEIPTNDLAQEEKPSEGNPPQLKTVSQDNQVAAENTLAESKSSPEDEFVPLEKFAKQKIKKDLLKGKTFSETVIDELAEASNEKITFEREKDEKGSTQKFALNIGKFSISRNK